MFSKDLHCRHVKTRAHYSTLLHFNTQKICSCGKHCEKRRYCLLQQISPFLTMFSTLYGTYLSFLMHFKMSSAICFNLNQSKILSSGNGLVVVIEILVMKVWLIDCMAINTVSNMISYILVANALFFLYQ